MENEVRSLPKTGIPPEMPPLDPTGKPNQPFQVSWLALAMAGGLIWVLFFNGLGVLGSWVSAPQASTTIYQTATAAPGVAAQDGVNIQKPIATPGGFTYIPQEPAIAPAGDTNLVLTAAASNPVPTVSGVAQNEATSLAMYQATAAAANNPIATPVGTSGPEAAGVTIDTYGGLYDGSDGGGVIPTSLPIPTANATGAQGQRPSKPVNIQETHQCLHGQTWVDGMGCRNPRKP